MSKDATKQVHELVNAFDHSKARQIFATLIRLPGDFDAAKATLHDAFARGDRSLGTSWLVGQLLSEHSRTLACVKKEVLAAHSVVHSFSSRRWFGVCRDIGRTPSSATLPQL